MQSVKARLRNSKAVLTDIVEEYKEWATTDCYMILNRMDYITYETCQYAVLMAKRGNSYYARRTLARFRSIFRKIPRITFFRDHDPVKTTRAIFVTLTYDTKRNNFHEAWQTISQEYNRFKANLSKQYGKLASVRCFESFSNGHPHVHALLIFRDHEFQVVPRNDEKGFYWGIKDDVSLDRYWHSRIKISASSSLHGGAKYISKYITKSAELTEEMTNNAKTLALTWLYNRRAFSVSGKLPEALGVLNLNCTTKTNSKKKIAQSTLTGEHIQQYVYTFLGVVPGDVLDLTKHQKTVHFIPLRPEQTSLAENYLNSRYG